jgi:predicted CXXCH cytochrome family protein
MLHLKKPSRRAWWLLAIVLALPGTGFCVWWNRSGGSAGYSAAAAAAAAQGDWGQVGRLARERLKHAPADPEATRLAARAAAHQDREQAAVSLYARLYVGELEPEDFYLLGRAMAKAGKTDEAFKAYEMARDGASDHPATLEALGQLYLQNDRYFAAEEVALKLAQHSEWEPRARLILGTARHELHDPVGASQALLRWRELDPEGKAAAPNPVPPFQFLLVRSLLRSGQPDLARRILLELGPAGAGDEAVWLLSRTFLQEKDAENFKDLLERAQSFRVQHPLEPEPAAYLGEGRCVKCHKEISRDVLASRHATTFSRGRDLAGLALPAAPLPDPGNPKVAHQFKRAGPNIQLMTQIGDRVRSAVVEYAFGSLDHYVTFVGPDEPGDWWMLRMSRYDSPRGRGWDLSTGLPPVPASEEEYLGKKMLGRDGVRRCLYCHTTNFHAVLVDSGPEAADHSIGCERCHGPGANHVTAVDAGFSDLAILNPGRASASEINEWCGKCHSMHRPGNIDAPRTDPVWYRFQALALTWSRCYNESGGSLSCITCHDPHRNVEKSAARNEAICLQCHRSGDAGARVPTVGRNAIPPHQQAPGLAPEPTAVGRNAIPPYLFATPAAPGKSCPVNPASGCISCHMPSAWQEGTHSFKTDHFIRVRERDAR